MLVSRSCPAHARTAQRQHGLIVQPRDGDWRVGCFLDPLRAALLLYRLTPEVHSVRGEFTLVRSRSGQVRATVTAGKRC
jgi:hypothetical protein